MLESQGRFSAWAVYPGLRSIALVICALVGATSQGIGWLLAGTLIGTLAGPLYFAVLAGLHRFNRVEGPGGLSASAAVPTALAALAGSLVLGAVTVSIDNAFASATGIGGVQALTIATNLLLVPQALIGGVVATVFFPVYASHWAQGDRSLALRALRRSARLVALGLLPFVILFCSPVGTMVARLVYRHGTFDESLTLLVGRTAAALALGQVAYAIFVLFKQFMLVVAKPVALLEASAVYLVAKWVGNRSLVGSMGLPGIALASSIASALACAYLLLRLWALRRSWKRTAV
jgi:putative peptidoglycan lipid II flippase